MNNLKNSKGFTLVETLLVLLVVAVIGFGGYYVWQNQHKDETKVSSTKAAVTKTETKSQSSDPYHGWKPYILPYEKLSFKYPSDWMLTNEDATTFNDTVTIKAPSGLTVYMNTGVQEGIGTPSIVENLSWATTFDSAPATLIFTHGGSRLSPDMGKIGGAVLVRSDSNRSGQKDKNVIGCSGCNGVNGPEGSYMQISFGGKEVTSDVVKTDQDYIKGKLIVESMHY